MREQLRAMLLKAKVLQLCTEIFAVFGVLLFAYIYVQQYSDNPITALRDPYLVFYILVPFLPAALLAFVVSRQRKKIKEIVDRMENTS